MTFVKTTQGVEVRVNAVREAFPGDDNTVILSLESGIQHVVSKDDWRRAERNSCWQVVSAASGTYILGYAVDEMDQLSVTRQPVVAWALSGDGSAYPVTQDGVDRDVFRPYAVLHPDGCVRDWDGLYDNEEQWLADMQHQIQVHQAEVKAATSTAH